MRLASIHSLIAANRFLKAGYMAAINEKFVKQGTKPEDAHVPLVDGTDLSDVLCFEEKRVVRLACTVNSRQG